MDKLAWAQMASLMPLRKPLAKWSIRFTFGAGIAVFAVDAFGHTPSIEVLGFLERIIEVTMVPVAGYILTSTVETVAKLMKGRGNDGHEEIDDSHHYRASRGGVAMGSAGSAYTPPGAETGRRGDA